MIELRPYQAEAVERIRESIKNGARRVVFVLPTGGGKTVVASYMVDAAQARGTPVLFVAHRIELIEQISDALHAFAIPHGIIAQGRSMTGLPVQVGMIGTVVGRAARLRHRPRLIIVDEAHHATAATYRRLIDLWPDAHVIGLTATPARTDGTGLAEVFDAIVVGPTIRELIEAGHLTPFSLLAPPTDIDLSGVRTARGDYARGELAKRVDRATVTGDAVEHYRQYAAPATFCAFCVSREHASHVADQFTAAGFPCAAIDGSMSMGERAEILSALRDGRLLGVSSCDLISEGFDLPRIGAAILLRPTQSLIVYLQQIGRALRTAPGKERAVILDHAGNVWRHGLPDMEREWTLEGRPKRRGGDAERGIAVKQCRSCFSVFPATLAACPHCATSARGAGAVREVHERDGRLIEITEAVRRADRWRDMPYQDAMREIRQAAREQGAFVAAGMLVEMANARGYKRGWALGRAQDVLGLPFAAAARAVGYSEIFIHKARNRQEAAA